MHTKQRNEAIRHVVAYIFTIVMVFLAVTPFIYVVLTALKTKEQIYDLSQIIPTHITFDNFRQVLFQSNFVRYFMNSIFITLVTTLICMILSVMAAYGLTRYRIVGAGKIKMAVLMTRMFPGILLCIPYYIIMKQLNLIDSYIGLILMYCSFTLPFAIWNTCAFFISIPWELEEAARIDGCSRLKSFFHVIIHVAKPGLFVVLPLCLALMLLNFYLQKVTTENKINNETDLLSQIRDNTDQMIEVTNYATSMLMTNKNTLKNLRILEQDGDSYEIYQAKRELSNDISDVESSVLNAVGGKVAILTKKGYMIGSYTLSRTETNYEKEQWYQEILENGRKTTYSTGIETMFQEMTIHDNIQKYFYMGREILDYSGKNLGVMLIRLSEKKIWGKLAAGMVTEEGGALYILDRNNDILMEYNEKYQKQLKELREQETVKEISENEITTGNLKDDFYYMEGELENDSNKLVYLVPQEIFLKENRKILQRILEMLLLVIGFTVCTMLYFSKRIAKPLVEVAQTLEKAPNGMAVLEEPRGSFKEMSKFVSCYNQAGKKIEELLEKVERESRLKEKAHYEMLMSQISPHFIFNTVNSIRIMAIKEGQDRAGGNENTEKALEALGDILHAVYSNKNGMTTVGQETALLKAYVDIMQMRFGSSFQYYNVIPTELFYYEIPAFTMQPIVENAILHGVKGVTAGQIIVSAIEYENDFVISVFNNGNSADKKKIEDLLKGEKNQRAVTGIGLYNVNSRLKLLYGESYGLIYNEKVRNGFEIWVRLPKKITESEER